jgi:hypothetical protein
MMLAISDTVLAFVAHVPIAISKSADWVEAWSFNQNDSSGAMLGPVDMTGATIEAEIVILPDDPGFIAKLSTSSATGTGIVPSSINILDVANGVIGVAVGRAVIDTWPTGTLYHVFRMITSAGIAIDLMRGPFEVHPRVF